MSQQQVLSKTVSESENLEFSMTSRNLPCVAKADHQYVLTSKMPVVVNVTALQHSHASWMDLHHLQNLELSVGIGQLIHMITCEQARGDIGI